MSTPFVAGLRSRKSTIDLSGGASETITIRVEMAEVWDVIRVVVAPSEMVLRVKEHALQELSPDSGMHEDFVMKLGGWEILDETASLADAGVVDGSILLLTYRRRRPVR
jgi:hypothetical protein